MELERQENVLVIGHQVHSFFYSIWSLSDGCDSAPCFAGDFALFVSAARRGRITLFALFVGEMCSFMFIHFSVYIFWGGCFIQIRIFPPSATSGFAIYQGPAAYSDKAYTKSVWM